MSIRIKIDSDCPPFEHPIYITGADQYRITPASKPASRPDPITITALAMIAGIYIVMVLILAKAIAQWTAR